MIGVRAASIPVALAVVISASGWLYLAGPHLRMPGPRVADALPLDELAHHSAVPLLVFVAVWGTAGVALGYVAAAFGLGRLTAALLLGLFVGGWTYGTTAVSILAVRQIAADSAFRDAGSLDAVLLPAVLAALSGALVARAGGGARRSRIVLAWFTAAAGTMGVVDSILPEHGHTVLADLAPGARPLASALAAPLALALVYVARGLGRGSQRAWQVALGLLVGSTLLHVAHSDYGALVTGLLAAALLARRGDFQVRGDPSARGRLLHRLALLAAGITAYGIAALWANRLAVDRPFSVGFAVRETAAAVSGRMLAGGSSHLSGPFGSWFGPSLFALGLAGAATLSIAWLAPWRFELDRDDERRRRAREIVAEWGTDTLAPFVLRADKSYFFGAEERSLVAYRVVGGVAIVSGDPLGPPEDLDTVVADFIAHVRSRGWRLAVLGASEDALGRYRAHGLRALYHGDEAVLDVDAFSLDGRAIRKVRQSVSRLAGAGYRAEVVRAADVDQALQRELEAIATEWRAGAPERGFTMALDSLTRLGGDDAVFVVGRDGDGSPQGFLHFAVSRPGAALSLSTMPRRRTTPNGFNEWLICETVAWARANGIRRISLNFSPFAALLAPEARLTPGQRLQRRALHGLKGHFQLDNLLRFNEKFLPSWERRFVVFESRLDLPRIGLAALAAEAYLPFARRRPA